MTEVRKITPSNETDGVDPEALLRVRVGAHAAPKSARNAFLPADISRAGDAGRLGAEAVTDGELTTWVFFFDEDIWMVELVLGGLLWGLSC